MLKNPFFYVSFILAVAAGGLAVSFVYAFAEPTVPFRQGNPPLGLLRVEAVDVSQGHGRNVSVNGALYRRDGNYAVDASGNRTDSPSGNLYLFLGAGKNFYIRDVQDGPRFVLDSAGRVGIGVPAPAYALDVLGDIRAQNAWLRTTGNTGWYSDTHGGGWYMQDSTWIRSYGSKNVYISNGLRADGGIASGVTDLPGAGNIVATGYVKAGGNSTGISTLIGDCEWKWSGWQDRDNAGNTESFYSPPCSSGYSKPISCYADCDANSNSSSCEDLMVRVRPALILRQVGSLSFFDYVCEAMKNDQEGRNEYRVAVGALCCEGIPPSPN